MSQSSRRALGKGLEQLFSTEQLDFDQFEKNIVNQTPKEEIEMIPINEIRSNPYQPRLHFDQESLEELAESIKERGVLEPIIVKKSIKGYELIAGERRTKASKLAGLTKIPAIIKDFNDEDMMEIAILENIQRENLSPIEEAKAYKNFMEKIGLTQEDVAKKFKKSRSYVTNLLGLLNLPDEVQKNVINHSISMSHARVLSKLSDEKLILLLADRIVKEGMSVHDLEKIASGKDISKRKPIKTKVESNNTRFRIYEDVMKEKIGSKVNISSNKIVIKFDSDKDLERILEILGIEVGEE